ncbi:MAG: class I SAM-dependent methyltransferase [bacterium]
MNFDAAYYQRYYHNPKTRAVSPEEQQRQVAFIAAYLRYLTVDVASIVDIGCGIGTFLAHFQKEYPDAACHGVEFSTYLCEQHGWQYGSVVDVDTPPADLVVCNDVLAYLDKNACAQAIHHLADLSQSALYLSVMTSEDIDNVDTEHSDMQQQPRPVRWYRKHLDLHFQSVGGGLFIKKPLTIPLWRLEHT